MRIPSCASSLHLLMTRNPPWVGVYGRPILAKFHIEDRSVVRGSGLSLLRPAVHSSDRFGGENELTRLYIDLRQARQQHMITATSVDDQELAIAAKLASVNNPAITR